MMVCPKCGANINIDSNSEYISCQYCNTNLRLSIEKSRSQIKQETLAETEKSFIQLGMNAMNVGNWTDAYKYFKKASEINPSPKNIIYYNMSSIMSEKASITDVFLSSLFQLSTENHAHCLNVLLTSLQNERNYEISKIRTQNQNDRTRIINNINNKYHSSISRLQMEINKIKPFRCICGNLNEYDSFVCSACGKDRETILEEMRNQQRLKIKRIILL